MCGQVFCGVKCEAHGVMEVGKCVSILQPLFSYCGRCRLRIIDRIDSVEGISVLTLWPLSCCFSDCCTQGQSVLFDACVKTASVQRHTMRWCPPVTRFAPFRGFTLPQW